MEVLSMGHTYVAANFEDPTKGQTIQFIEKVLAPGTASDGSLIDELVTVNDGTTNEELLAILIDRMNYLQGKFPCDENTNAISNLEQALGWLEKRTADRKARQVEGKHVA